MKVIRWNRIPHAYPSSAFAKLQATIAVLFLAICALLALQSHDVSPEEMLVALLVLPTGAVLCWLGANALARRLNELTITTDFQSGVIINSSRVVAVFTFEEFAEAAQVSGVQLLIPSLGIAVTPTHLAAARLRKEVAIRQGKFGPAERNREKFRIWLLAGISSAVFGGILIAASLLEWRLVSEGWNYIRMAATALALGVAVVAAVRVASLSREYKHMPPN